MKLNKKLKWARWAGCVFGWVDKAIKIVWKNGWQVSFVFYGCEVEMETN
jgi:hypothetical protein